MFLTGHSIATEYTCLNKDNNRGLTSILSHRLREDNHRQVVLVQLLSCINAVLVYVGITVRTRVTVAWLQWSN